MVGPRLSYEKTTTTKKPHNIPALLGVTGTFKESDLESMIKQHFH